MGKIKLTYIVSDIDKALAFEWVAQRLSKADFALTFVIIGRRNTYLEKYLKIHEIPVTVFPVQRRASYLSVFFKLFFFLLHQKPDIIHCHLRTAELIGMPAGFLARVRSRIYTRHSSTYNHLYHPKGVLIDRIINRLATQIVAISENVKQVLTDLEGVKESKIVLVRHGFDLQMFMKTPEQSVEKLRKKYNLHEAHPTIGIIARYTWWKGYKYSIPAIANVLKKYPSGKLILANAKGNHSEEIKKLLNEKIPSEKYLEIEFEHDIPSLYRLFDIYVHVPVDASVEAFGQTYVEALASGIPSVFTLSGIAREFVKDKENAMVVDFQSSSQIEKAVTTLIESNELKETIIKNGQKSIAIFDLSIFINKLEQLYLSAYES